MDEERYVGNPYSGCERRHKLIPVPNGNAGERRQEHML
jgi:hypothetical protein